MGTTTTPPVEGVVAGKDKSEVTVKSPSPDIKSSRLQNLIEALGSFEIEPAAVNVLAAQSQPLQEAIQEAGPSSMEALPEAYAGMFEDADTLNQELKGVDVSKMHPKAKEKAQLLAEQSLIKKDTYEN